MQSEQEKRNSVFLFLKYIKYVHIMVYHIIAQSVCFSEWQPSVDDMDWQAGLSSQKNTASRLACSCFENSSGLPNVYPIETMWTCRLAHTDDKHLFKEPRVHKCLFKRIKLWIIKSLSTVCLLECWQLLYFYENLLVWADTHTRTCTHAHTVFV